MKLVLYVPPTPLDVDMLIFVGTIIKLFNIKLLYPSMDDKLKLLDIFAFVKDAINFEVRLFKTMVLYSIN